MCNGNKAEGFKLTTMFQGFWLLIGLRLGYCQINLPYDVYDSSFVEKIVLTNLIQQDLSDALKIWWRSVQGNSDLESQQELLQKDFSCTVYQEKCCMGFSYVGYVLPGRTKIIVIGKFIEKVHLDNLNVYLDI